MGLGRPPHQPGLVQVGIDVGERRGREVVEVVGEGAHREVVAFDRPGTGGALTPQRSTSHRWIARKNINAPGMMNTCNAKNRLSESLPMIGPPSSMSTTHGPR